MTGTGRNSSSILLLGMLLALATAIALAEAVYIAADGGRPSVSEIRSAAVHTPTKNVRPGDVEPAPEAARNTVPPSEFSRDPESGLFLMEASPGPGMPEIPFIVDTGSYSTIIRSGDVSPLGAVLADRPVRNVTTAGSTVPARSAVIPRLDVGGTVLYRVEAYVIDTDLPRPLLGLNEISRLGLVAIDGDGMSVGPTRLPPSMD